MTASEYNSPAVVNLGSSLYGIIEPALARQGVHQTVDPVFGVRLGGAHQQVAIERRIDLGQVQSSVDPVFEQTRKHLARRTRRLNDELTEECAGRG